jgi:hypothetical protein
MLTGMGQSLFLLCNYDEITDVVCEVNAFNCLLQ